jgi:hypothetical protein
MNVRYIPHAFVFTFLSVFGVARSMRIAVVLVVVALVCLFSQNSLAFPGYAKHFKDKMGVGMVYINNEPRFPEPRSCMLVASKDKHSYLTIGYAGSRPGPAYRGQLNTEMFKIFWEEQVYFLTQIKITPLVESKSVTYIYTAPVSSTDLPSESPGATLALILKDNAVELVESAADSQGLVTKRLTCEEMQ